MVNDDDWVDESIYKLINHTCVCVGACCNHVIFDPKCKSSASSSKGGVAREDACVSVYEYEHEKGFWTRI